MSAHTPIDDDLDGSSAPLIEHLIELRRRIIWSMVAFIVAMVLCYTVWNSIYNILTQPICGALAERGQNCQLQIIKLQEGFFTAINISFFGGFVLAFPVIGYQLWRFVAPGLYRSEKAAFAPFLTRMATIDPTVAGWTVETLGEGEYGTRLARELSGFGRWRA